MHVLIVSDNFICREAVATSEDSDLRAYYASAEIPDDKMEWLTKAWEEFEKAQTYLRELDEAGRS